MEKLNSSTRSTVLGITRLAANTRQIPYMDSHFEGLDLLSGRPGISHPTFAHRLKGFAVFSSCNCDDTHAIMNHKAISTDCNRSL